MTRNEVLKLIAAVHAYWPNWNGAPTTDEEMRVTATAWLAVLEDLPKPLVVAAVTSLSVSAREWVPPVGVIRRTAIELKAHAEGTLPPGADVAWSQVQEAVQHIGLCGSAARWWHPVVHAAVQAIGWRDLCLSENQVATRAHFIKFYAEARERYMQEISLTPAIVEAVRAVAVDGRPRPELDEGGRHLSAVDVD